MITDQATGPVAARQRLLRSYGNRDGEMTLWGEEFAGMINNKGRFDAEGDLTTSKAHGFGFSLGMDAGSARARLVWRRADFLFQRRDRDPAAAERYQSGMVHADRLYRLARQPCLPRYQDRCRLWQFRRQAHADHRQPGPHRRRQARRPPGRAGRHHRPVPELWRRAIHAAYQPGRHEHARGRLYRNGRRRRLRPAGRALLRQLAAHLPGRGHQEEFRLWGATISPEVRLGYRYDFINCR